MKFKIDENLPVELVEVLAIEGHDAATVIAQGLQGRDDKTIVYRCLEEERILVTLDLDFADIRAYPPQDFHGFIVFRGSRQDRDHLISLLRQVLPLMRREPLERHLWIVEDTRVRIRGPEREE
jgi:predicted nuclease of predicted toxin-antitoxin system